MRGVKIGAAREAKKPEVSVILPCRDEEKTIGLCIGKIRQVFKKEKINGEIIVSDSSTDDSASIADESGAKVIKHGKIGYGNAYFEGFRHARGRYIIMGDSDNTYDFGEITKFLHYLRDKDYDFVIGNRFNGMIKKGAMPFLHRYIGNPLLSFISRIFFRTGIYDINCGFRAIDRRLLDRLGLEMTGMEFASEMVIKAVKYDARIKEIPVNYYERVGESKLRTLRDGWKHISFMVVTRKNEVWGNSRCMGVGTLKSEGG
ncbi:hypothetical protein COV19_04090 [Candidatus Woesearchaeota archaeon CG10_big_fil_rev_8_21_14_0_10_44_13]|nr:MAG: hypothetical protein COV19_04090 [Candidatus Woesearchaeota archaeon CG10_big_fil_rev_8_21_14_0_10_44_13]